MLRGVNGGKLVSQWRNLQAELPDAWVHARLALSVTNLEQLDRAAALLGPLTPGRAGSRLRFDVARRGHALSPAAVERALTRIDAERIRGTLAVVEALDTAPAGYAPAAGAPVPEMSLAEAWDALVDDLPDDWSDVYAQIDFTSSDHLDPAALALAPVNPARYGSALGFRFRCARSFGYGAAPKMVRQCFVRLDKAEIEGTVSILRVLSDTNPVATQGPVWYVDGKTV
jgi:hypothetical protein